MLLSFLIPHPFHLFLYLFLYLILFPILFPCFPILSYLPHFYLRPHTLPVSRHLLNCLFQILLQSLLFFANLLRFNLLIPISRLPGLLFPSSLLIFYLLSSLGSMNGILLNSITLALYYLPFTPILLACWDHHQFFFILKSFFWVNELLPIYHQLFQNLMLHFLTSQQCFSCWLFHNWYEILAL